MSLATLKDVLSPAQAQGYAVGAFNVHGLEIAQAIASGAEKAQAPVIFQVNQATLKYAGIKPIAALVSTLAADLPVPAVVHLDHGTSFETVMQCIRRGFTSVMVDASHLAYTENVALVRRVVEAAHAAGVSVEAELGHIGGTEDDIIGDGWFTDPNEAAAFVEETGVDALAVAIGTAHGLYRETPRLDFARLLEIRRLVSVPLVLHGASGVPDQCIAQAVRLGVQKINISTELKVAFTAAVRRFLEEYRGEFDPRRYLGWARQAVEEVVVGKIALFGGVGRVRPTGMETR